jgi:2-polyprenyl-3-methyl-5-hydroxy-6-metoxy-1,4-benzoquinol methylase
MSKSNHDRVLTAEELWNCCQAKYNSNNPVIKMMIRNFFAKIRRVVALLDANDRILEVGCGAGESSRRILDMLAGQEFEASDIDERYIAELKETDFPVPVRQESVLDIKRKNKEFDCVFMLELLEHVPEYERALSEAFRVSRKFVVVSVPNEPLWRILNMCRGKYLKDWGNTPTHVNHWSPKSIQNLISRYGTVIKTYTPFPWTIVLAQVCAGRDYKLRRHCSTALQAEKVCAVLSVAAAL